MEREVRTHAVGGLINDSGGGGGGGSDDATVCFTIFRCTVRETIETPETTSTL